MHDELQRHNRRATVGLLIAGFLLLLVVTVAAEVLLFGFLGDWGALTAATVPLLVVAVAVAGVGSGVAWWNSDRVALRSARAKRADPAEYPDLHRLVEGLAVASGLPVPRLYVVDDPAPNAFATGRNPEKAAVAVTTGLLEKLERRELEAVLAHELGHIRNNDLLTATVAVTLAGATLLLADLARRMLFFGAVTGRGMGRGMGRGGGGRGRGGGGGAAGLVLLIVSLVLIVLAPIAAQLIRSAVSRQREYLADATSVEFTRDPAAMIRALEALKADTTVIDSASRATAHLWIEEPVDLKRRANRRVATHPPLQDRIARLQTLYPQPAAGETDPSAADG